VQWVNRFVCYLTAGQRNRRADVWQTTAISLPRVTCDEEPFQCVNRQIAGALHFKLMHSTVPSMGPPYHAGRSIRISNRHVRDCAIRERSTDVKEKRLFEMTLYTDRTLVASTYTTCMSAFMPMCSVRANTPNEARRSINVSRGVISFSTDSCVKYQIKRAECLFKWSFVVANVPWRRR